MQINLTKNIIKSTRGKEKIAFESYFYNYTHTNLEIMYWRCNKRGCTSILKTNVANELIVLSVHNHLKDEIKYFRTMLKQKMSDRALSSNESSRNVVLGVLKDNQDMKVPVNIRKLNSFVGCVRRCNNFFIEKDYDIPVELQVSNNNKRFLLFDSGLKDENRVLIFSTDENIIHLVNSKILICDGTFKTSPSCFEQIFTLQVKLRGIYLLVMFCFMKNKREITYDKIFAWLMTSHPNVISSTKSIIIDFELGSYNVLKRYFSNSSLYGCNFHFGQILWRRIQVLKFSNIFINNSQVKLQVKMILALSFVPPSDVVIVAARLKSFLVNENIEEVLILFDWFQTEYLLCKTGNKAVHFWNVFERTKFDVPRTTNSLEGYHRHLNTLINIKQSSIITILNELKNEQFVVENKIFMSLYKEITIIKDPVKKLIDSYGTYQSIEYLIHIALNFNWKLD
ncbi:hypothetical protein DMUE_3596 [Dictyocoela muelleri]|nr:hypothetical protein DMUE_3596 [Dictyocoela muelleri]